MLPAIVLFFVLMVPSVAFGQVDTEVTFENIAGYILSALAAVLMAVATYGVDWVRRWAKKKWSIEIDDKYAEVINQTIWRGVDYAKAQGYKLAANTSITIENDVVREVARYVERSVPDALRHHGLSEDRLAEIIMSRLGALTDGLFNEPHPPVGR